MIAAMFIKAGHPPGLVLKYVGVASSTYYDSLKPKTSSGKCGIKASSITYTKQGKSITNEQVVDEIIDLLEQEFVDYGYRKVTWWLRRKKGYVINEKKVYRLMKENGLLNKMKTSPRIKREWVKELLPQPSCSLEYLEIDIKYVYVHAMRKNALIVTVIDVDSRLVLGQYLNWSIRKKDIEKLFNQIFELHQLPKRVYVRNDNGSQFVASCVQKYFARLKVIQEFIKPATPEQNAHIESYHSIVERVICRRYQFESLDDTRQTFNRFIRFYNYERIHSGIKYQSPVDYLESNNVSLPAKEKLMASCLACENLKSKMKPQDILEKRLGEAFSMENPPKNQRGIAI